MAAGRPAYQSLLKVLRNGLRSKVAQRAVAREVERRGAPAPGSFVVAVHFPDFPVNLYQIRQWYAPLARLHEHVPVVIVARFATTARALLAESPVPVVLAPRISAVEELLAQHPIRVMLYVNQNIRNFAALRFRDPLHVFISHGESDKDYMVSNQLRAYDYALVAGPAAVQRLARLRDYDAARRAVQIGRPQVDVVVDGPPLPQDERIVVLYAPTWEGDRSTMSYSSVLSHGEDMVAALLADPRFRVVFRPHPRTGVADPEAGAAVRRIGRRLVAANRADPGARHLWDRQTPFGWHTRACDVCITDISAVAYDWLATARPLVVTEPAAPEAAVERSALVETVGLMPAAEASRVHLRVLRLLEDDGTEGYSRLVRHYYGDVTPGASMTRFLTAVTALVERRDADATPSPHERPSS